MYETYVQPHAHSNSFFNSFFPKLLPYGTLFLQVLWLLHLSHLLKEICCHTHTYISFCLLYCLTVFLSY